MSDYFEVIKTALLYFPFIAFAISLPFVLSQYHKYGSISVWKSFVIYSFVLYLTCAYFLVILPLPDRAEVAAMTTPRAQLIPFKFVGDFVTHTSLNILDIKTYWSALTESYVFVPLYNILLTLPFGMYLRYFCKMDLKKTVLMSFLLSLFFELTQLTGLYFIYPRGYRLFDVDDLILNTLGGLLGYFAVKPLLKVLPDPAEIDANTKERGKTVSGFRRTLAFWGDIVIYLISCLAFRMVTDFRETLATFAIMFAIYYLVIPLFLHGRTLMEKFLKLKIVDENGEYNYGRFVLREILFVVIYLAVPVGCLALLENVVIRAAWPAILTLMVVGAYFIGYAVVAFKFLFTTKPLLYEKLSKTKLASTIK